MTDAKLQALGSFEENPSLTADERMVLHYAVGMTETPVEVGDELFERLESRFNHRQLVELTSCIAWENYRARFDHAFGIEAEGFSDGSFCPLPEPTRSVVG